MKISEKDYNRLRTYMQENYGINLANKINLIEGRLSSIVEKQGYDNFADYLDFIFCDAEGKHISTLITKLTTNYTYFMREKKHYDFLNEVALPEFLKKIPDRDLRTWSAGCSSGEEAYTTAMLYDEFFGRINPTWETSILATDISERVLSIATNAEYPQNSIEKIPPAWVKKHFNKIDAETYALNEQIKKQVIFRHFNLMAPSYTFRKKFHIIFCRNVMIYFDNNTRTQVVNKFYESQAPGGYLFIGLSETLANIETKYTYVMPSIYKKIG